jgi:hypothetical protein
MINPSGAKEEFIPVKLYKEWVFWKYLKKMNKKQ